MLCTTFASPRRAKCGLPPSMQTCSRRSIEDRSSRPRRQFFCDEVGRREFVCGGGAGVLSVILATLLGGSKPVRAEAVTGSVPELDRVAVRIVIDSYQFAVAPSRKLHSLDVQHFGWGLSDKP